ncbi:MAG: hypothetical protein CO064_05420 [Anaerolineae bacterium CG_4_9_14_0_8_um_filter_58_9]|nr:MAG: hypothetical protein CO064_05420 [Anaerolineae bacterium CG_4_9_14_0_8_um_filter_58_9]
MKWKFLTKVVAQLATIVLLLALLFVFIAPGAAFADGESCTIEYNEDGSFVKICTGGEEGGGGGGESCTPGTVNMQWVLAENRGDFCLYNWTIFDQCTGEIFYKDPHLVPGPCPAAVVPPENPCTTFEIGPGGVYCNASKWLVQAQVSFPEVYLDVRPYPASLVRWPTAMRTQLQPNSGSGTLAYYSPSGGSSSSPHVGDLANITLTLSLQPVGKTHIQIPQIGVYETSGGSAYCISVNRIILAQGIPPKKFCWEVPSHPAAGGGPLAGTISGLDELPADMPVFAGFAHAPYHLFWNLSYQKYVRYCPCGSCESSDVPGINSWRLEGGKWEPFCDTNIPSGATGNCSVSVPAECNYDYKWESHSQGGEILPSQVQGLPPSLAADLDGNGTPDAYWNNNLTIRRMDDYDRVGTSAWGRSWNWGGTIYWGVREGQGQIGWPGVP